MESRPKVSVVIPIHPMQNGEYFLWRSVQALMAQTFKDFELVITQEGTMPENTNAGIRKARGELIKVLYLDDYLAHPNALQTIVDNFLPEDMWLVTGCLHQGPGEKPHSAHYPQYREDIHTGHNTIGSPSVLVLRNEAPLLFDEQLSWLLDCDLYKRLYQAHGAPHILNDLSVVIGTGPHQTTHALSDERKRWEFNYLANKYATT